MSKKITVVFYPDGARIFKGEYKHEEDYPCLVDPKELPLGIPMHLWKLDGDKIVTPGFSNKVRPQPISEIKPIINQTIINGLTKKDLEEYHNQINNDFNNLIGTTEEKFQKLLHMIMDQGNLTSDQQKEIVNQFEKLDKISMKRNKLSFRKAIEIIGLSSITYIILHLINNLM